VPVSERRRHVYAYIQPHLYDAVDWTLERMSAVPHPNATRLSVQHVGRHQRAAGCCALSLCSLYRQDTVSDFALTATAEQTFLLINFDHFAAGHSLVHPASLQ